MGSRKTFNHNLATIGWGALLVWWGVAFMIEPLTLGMCAIGSGLILLGINAVRFFKGIPTVASTTTLGFIALAWGALDQASTLLGIASGASFALLLMVIGAVILLGVFRPHASAAE
jgi:hypothetical protein